MFIILVLRSEGDIILWKKCLYPPEPYVCDFMSNSIMKSWKDFYHPSHSSGCHSSERNDTPEAQGDRSVTSHLDTWAESATPIIDRWRPLIQVIYSQKKISSDTGYLFLENIGRWRPCTGYVFWHWLHNFYTNLQELFCQFIN